MRKITSHQGNALNNAIDIAAIGAPGPSGSNDVYELHGAGAGVRLEFHTGPMDQGPKGLSTESLIAIAIDRIEGKQRGPYPCKDNEDALAMFKGGLTCLQKRTATRQAQGVEGQNVPHTETPAAAPVKPAIRVRQGRMKPAKPDAGEGS
jgi:hypothetical protein